ncbi:MULTISPECIES: tyrosine-type recombinase/integrase [Brenneria]|uniref:Integrase n=1 Tax=Brenneria nigrifluens DSM 30175 = ATCC 13028 TaxID=1121120 RepID=A0A2U1UVY4_9GAMM|nr:MULTISPECIES: tyrosine-type recombinase/integrase [Brenneria]EHD22801.1 integrase family protein [Brenneria sp. EniD312]PWC25844.1 integrase [Brenneria nigrifluens] [Brenneria nigrifluens DSM 30175 = ATCC 13028]QCR05772.1 integrase [Brenneria nigrifluens] [Brenneria nigrifluens DSM 30175 = ATCC 13028]
MTTYWNGFHSPLAPHIEQYLRVKRAVGCKFSCEDRQLRLLDRYLDDCGIDSINAIDGECLQAFLDSRYRTNPRSYNNLLGYVRRLFDWIVCQQFLASSPLRSGTHPQTARRLPYLFSPETIRRLLALAGTLPDNARAQLRGATYEMIFALLAGLGLRVSEVACLQWGDVDWERDLLEIRDTKFGKDRLVPFGPRLSARLHAYQTQREQRGYPGTGAHYMFSWNDRTPISTNSIRNTFRDDLLPPLALAVPTGVFGPHVHGLRHSFAVRTLLNWYRQGIAPADRLHHLSTFLGHLNPTSTAVYLTITSELLDAANQRFESIAPALSEGGSQ